MMMKRKKREGGGERGGKTQDIIKRIGKKKKEA